ncbi:hypothetical protein A6R68_18305, partial [Neotoma lepida]
MWLPSAILGPLLYISKRPELFLMFYALQLYYGPFNPLLSSREQFPYLYQVAPKDTSLTLAM